MSTVSIARFCSDPVADFDRVMALAGLGGVVPQGGIVLIKPNQHGGHGFTSAAVIRAAVLWCQARGASEVWVGDGPHYGFGDCRPYFRETGLLDVCRETGALPLDFHQGDYEVIKPGTPDLPESIGISRYLFEADAVINLALMKTHFNTLVTLGIKNLKGCLRPADKRACHELELNTALADLAAILRPLITATVIDATTAYEGMGPAAGTPVDMGLLLASADLVAVDTVATHLMGIDPEHASKIRLAAERGVGERNLAQITITGEDPADHRRSFRLPYEAFLADYPNLTLHSEHACSGCAMNLFRALDIASSHGQELQCRTVVLGPSIVTEGPTLLVGNCTRAGWTDAPHVPGCPPRVDNIRAALTGIETREDVPRT